MAMQGSWEAVWYMRHAACTHEKVGQGDEAELPIWRFPRKWTSIGTSDSANCTWISLVCLAQSRETLNRGIPHPFEIRQATTPGWGLWVRSRHPLNLNCDPYIHNKDSFWWFWWYRPDWKFWPCCLNQTHNPHPGGNTLWHALCFTLTSVSFGVSAENPITVWKRPKFPMSYYYYWGRRVKSMYGPNGKDTQPIGSLFSPHYHPCNTVH